MLAKLPFRSKLTLVVSVPLIVLLVFAGSVIKNSFDDLGAQEQYGEVLPSVQALNAAGVAIGNESVASEAYLGDPATKPNLVKARLATDAAVAAVRDAAPSLDGHVNGATQRSVDLLLLRLPRIEGSRQTVDEGSMWISYFSPLARASVRNANAVANDLEDRDLAAGLSSVVDIRRLQVARSDEATIVLHALRYAGPGGDITTIMQGMGTGAWFAAISDQQAASRSFTEHSTRAQQRAFARAGGNGLASNPVRSDRFSGTFPTVLDVTTASYVAWYTQQQERLDTSADSVQQVVNDVATAKESDTRTQTALVSLGTALVILIVLALAWVLVRGVNRPLRALTRAARDMSERRLPLLVDTLHRGGELTPEQLEELAPIRVESQDEIGELAKAFSTIQQVTVSVAEEQSELLKKGIGDLYVNLARRNQSLLDRQISLLDDMEATVDDADELGSLFELDHLATRMRRNAESLLVMSGAGQPRQWGSAIPVLDVVRAAAAEIADFARVSSFGFEGDVAVAGNAVADVTHLLAELLENAAAFSPPETPVVVAGHAVERRFVITITDEGIGMEEPRIAAANALLARPPAPGLSLSRTLGLHVVAHLASRYGIHVQLRRAPSSGLTAVVTLPATVLASTVGSSSRSSDTVEHRPADGDGAVRSAPVRAEPVPERPVPAAIAPVPVAAVPPTRAEPPSPSPATDGPDRIAWRMGEPAPPAAPVPPSRTDERADPDGLTRRVPAGAPPASNGAGNRAGLTTRTPGANLTYTPGSGAAVSSGDVRPRPERVQDLLSRHERGKRDGRVRAPETPDTPG